MNSYEDIKKFGLNYKIEVQGWDNNIYTIQSYEDKYSGNGYIDKLESLAVKINIEKQNTNSANKCRVEIYNLAESTRKAIKKSRLLEADQYRSLKIYAGYKDFITLIFAGSVSSAESYRQGCDFVTSIDGMDNYGMVNSFTSISLEPKYDSKKMFETLVNDMPFTQIGYITDKATPFDIGERGRTFQGKTWQIISELNTDLDIFINDEKFYAMTENEVLTSDYLTLDTESGLLQEPREYDEYLEVKTLFEPLAVIGNLVNLNSELLPEYNGDYTLIGLSHNLEIEKIGRSSEATSILRLRYQKEEFDRVQANKMKK